LIDITEDKEFLGAQSIRAEKIFIGAAYELFGAVIQYGMGNGSGVENAAGEKRKHKFAQTNYGVTYSYRH